MRVAVLAFVLSWAGSWVSRRMPVAAEQKWPRDGGKPARLGRLGPGARRLAEWLAAAVPSNVPLGRRHRSDRRLLAALPDALDRLAADLRSGGSLLAALEALAAGQDPLAADLGDICDRVAAGHPLADALAAWPDQRPLPAVAAVAAALEVAASVGGRSATALEGLAAGLRDRHDTQREAAALSAQARVSALVVGLAPVGSLGFSVLADRRVPAALVGTGPGRICLAAGIGLDALAFVWMHRVLRRAR